MVDYERIANDPDAWIAHYLGQYEENPAGGMGKALAMALLRRIDAHGRDQRTGQLYAIDTLRAAFAVCAQHHHRAPTPD